MVGIAQLAERLVVVQEVAGSSPVTHPNDWFDLTATGRRMLPTSFDEGYQHGRNQPEAPELGVDP